MPEYKISIKTEADLKAAEALDKHLNNAIATTKKAGGETKKLEEAHKAVKVTLEGEAAAHARRITEIEKSIRLTKQLGGDTKALTAELRASQQALGVKDSFMGRMGTRFNNAREAYGEGHSRGGVLGGTLAVAGLMNPATAAGLAAGAVAVKTASKALDEFGKSEEKIFKMNAALALRGQLTSEYSSRLQDLASAQQRATAIADDDWFTVITTGTKAGAGPENIEKFVKGVEDLAGVMNSDVTTAAQMMAKAMQGNFTMLSRWGIEVDKNATQAEKLDSVFRQVEARGAGQLRAGAQGLEGAFKRVRLAGSDLWENLGNGINRIFGVDILVNGLANAMGWLAEKTYLAIEPARGLKNSIDGLPEVLEDTGAATKKAADQFERLGENLEDVRQKADLAKASIDRAKSIEDQEAEASKRLELAQVDDDVSRNRISKTQGEVRKAAIEQRYARASVDRETRADEQTLAANKEIRDAIIANEMIAKARAGDIQKQLTPEEEIEAARSRHAEAEAEAAALRKQLDVFHAERVVRGIGPNSGGPVSQIDVAAIEKRLEELAIISGSADRFVSTRSAKNLSARADLEAFESERAKQTRLNAQALSVLDDEEAGIRANMQSRRRVFGIDTKTRATSIGTELYEMRNDPKAADEVKVGIMELRKINAEQNQLVRDFVGEMLGLSFKNLDDYKKAVEMIREIREVQKKTNRQ